MPEQGKQFIPSNKSTEKFLKTSVLGPSVGPAKRRKNKKESNKVNKAIEKSGGFPESTKSEEDQIEEGFARADMERDWDK